MHPYVQYQLYPTDQPSRNCLGLIRLHKPKKILEQPASAKISTDCLALSYKGVLGDRQLNVFSALHQ